MFFRRQGAGRGIAWAVFLKVVISSAARAAMRAARGEFPAQEVKMPIEFRLRRFLRPGPRAAKLPRPPAREPLSRILRTAGCCAALAVGGLLSCDGTGPAADDPPGSETAPLSSVLPFTRQLRSIEVTPQNPTLLVDLNQKGIRTFKVLARYNDRSTANVSAAATYTLDNPAVGTLAAGSFESAVRATAQVGFTGITIRYREGGVEATVKTALTVAWLRTSGASPDLLLTLPYGATTTSSTVSFGTTVQALDAFFAVDTTGSMGGEINEIRRSLDATILPAVHAAAGDAWVGVGAVEDFPADSYGSPGCGGSGDDQPFILLNPMTSDLMAAKGGFDKLLRGSAPRGCGSDLPEGQFEALYQIATGNGNVVSGVVNVPPHHTKGRGGVEFRDGALPVVTMITDATFHTLGEPTRMCFGAKTDYSGAVALAAHSRADTTAALKNVCARVIGLSADTGSGAECIATADLRQLASDTGAAVPPQAWGDTGSRPAGCAGGQCCTGLGGAGEAPDARGLCPLVMQIRTDGTGTGPGAADAITQLVRFAPVEVNLARSGGSKGEDGTALPAGKTTADFLTAITAVDGTPPAVPSGLKSPVASGDHFTGVTPGSAVRFTLDAKNDFIAAGSKPQVFKATVQTLASGCAVLDTRTVIVIVPAA